MLNSLIGLIILILDIIALVDIFKSSMTTLMKVVWAVIVIVFPVVGMAIYFIIGRRGKIM